MPLFSEHSRARRWRTVIGVATSAAIAACGCARSTASAMPDEQTATVVRHAEIQSIAERPDTAVAYDSVARVVAVKKAGGYNIALAVVRRSRMGHATPPDAIAHHDITEIYHIVEGSAVFVSGGTIIGGSEMAPDSRGVRRVVGPSARGVAITGGRSVDVGPGDAVIVPPDTPHGFSRIVSQRLVYTVVRVDPRRRLPVTP